MSGDSTSKTPRFVGFPPSIEIAPGATRHVDLDAYFEGVSGFSFTVRSSLDPATATATAIGTRLIVEAAEEGETKLIVLASEPGNPANFAQGLIPVVVSSQFAPSSGKGPDPGGDKAPHARHPRDRRLFRRGLPPLSDGGFAAAVPWQPAAAATATATRSRFADTAAGRDIYGTSW